MNDGVGWSLRCSVWGLCFWEVIRDCVGIWGILRAIRVASRNGTRGLGVRGLGFVPWSSVSWRQLGYKAKARGLATVIALAYSCTLGGPDCNFSALEPVRKPYTLNPNKEQGYLNEPVARLEASSFKPLIHAGWVPKSGCSSHKDSCFFWTAA